MKSERTENAIAAAAVFCLLLIGAIAGVCIYAATDFHKVKLAEYDAAQAQKLFYEKEIWLLSDQKVAK